jgi:hypothetical protein
MKNQIIIFFNKFSGISHNLLISNDEYVWLDSNSIKKYDDLKISIYIISDLFNSFPINLPETSFSNQKKAIPFLIQDRLIEDINNYVWSINDELKTISIANKEDFKKIVSEIDLYKVDELIPLENAIKENILILCDGTAIINIGNRWNWSGSIEQLYNYIPDLKERYSIEKLDCYYFDDSMEKLKPFEYINFKSFESFQDVLENILPLRLKNNFLFGEFEPRVNWMNIFNKFRFYIYSFAALFSIFLFTAIIEFSFLNIKNSQLEDNLNRIFIKKFPNEKIKSNIISQVSSLLSSSILSKNRLDLISLLSKEIANIENISLVSINYDSSNFSFELEARDYQDIQDLVDTLQSRQINISIGSSRRANNFIIGELNVQDS